MRLIFSSRDRSILTEYMRNSRFNLLLSSLSFKPQPGDILVAIDRFRISDFFKKYHRKIIFTLEYSLARRFRWSSLLYSFLFDICFEWEPSASPRSISFLPCFPPRVGLTHESSHVIEVKSLDYFIENTFLRDKNRDLSVIVSSKSVLPWQRLRLKLISDICSTLSVSRYGREFNPISDKSDGLLNYRYHIACENSPLGPSEKLWDPLLCSCVVFYAGDLRLVHPFLRKAIIPIPVNSSSRAISIIQAELSSSRILSELDHDYWHRAKIILMNHYSFQALLTRYLSFTSLSCPF